MVHGAYIALATTDECDTIFVRCNARAATAADAPRRTHLPIRNHMIFCALRSTCRIKLHACHGGRRCRRCTQYRVESVCVRHYSELYTHDFFFFIPFFGLMARCSNTANSKFDRRKVKMHVFISSSSSLIMRLRRLLLVVKPSSKSNAISRKHGQFLLLIAPTFDKKKKTFSFGAQYGIFKVCVFEYCRFDAGGCIYLRLHSEFHTRKRRPSIFI